MSFSLFSPSQRLPLRSRFPLMVFTPVWVLHAHRETSVPNSPSKYQRHSLYPWSCRENARPNWRGHEKLSKGVDVWQFITPFHFVPHFVFKFHPVAPHFISYPPTLLHTFTWSNLFLLSAYSSPTYSNQSGYRIRVTELHYNGRRKLSNVSPLPSCHWHLPS